MCVMIHICMYMHIQNRIGANNTISTELRISHEQQTARIDRLYGFFFRICRLAECENLLKIVCVFFFSLFAKIHFSRNCGEQ